MFSGKFIGQAARQRALFRVGQRRLLGLEHLRQLFAHGGRRQAAVGQLAHLAEAVDHSALQGHLRFEALPELHAQHLEAGIEVGGRDNRPFAVELSHMVGRELVVAQQNFGLVNAGLAALQFGLAMTNRVQPGLHQLGDPAIGVANGAIDPFELGP